MQYFGLTSDVDLNNHRCGFYSQNAGTTPKLLEENAPAHVCAICVLVFEQVW